MDKKDGVENDKLNNFFHTIIRGILDRAKVKKRGSIPRNKKVYINDRCKIYRIDTVARVIAEI